MARNAQAFFQKHKKRGPASLKLILKIKNKIATLNNLEYEQFGDPEIAAKIQQYEMAFRMQTAVPEIIDTSKESDSVIKMYGPDCLVPGTYAANCLLARKLSESGVRFIQLYHQGWDQHGNLPNEMRGQAKDVDQPSAALIKDLKQRGLLDETLVIWGGEFGRTPMQENREGKTMGFKGRDHHVDAFTMWMAGAGIKNGSSYGQTDDFGFSGVEGKVSVHDVHATILQVLGFDHEKFTYDFQGRPFRLTDVEGEIIRDILA